VSNLESSLNVYKTLSALRERYARDVGEDCYAKWRLVVPQHAFRAFIRDLELTCGATRAKYYTWTSEAISLITPNGEFIITQETA